MPKIRIKERDLTTNPLIGVNEQHILYVLSKEQQTIASEFNSNEITEDTAPREITAEEAEKLEAETNNKFLSEAIALGGKIIVSHNWKNALDYCGDRNQYDIKFILAKEDEVAIPAKEDPEPAVPAQTELEVALKIAQKRKDCAVLYCKVNPDYKTNQEESNLLTRTCDYIGTTADASTSDKGFFSDEEKQPAGKYVIPLYAKDEIHKIAEIADIKTTLDAHEAYVLAFLNNLNKGYAAWNAVAGATRGLIPGNYEVDGFLKESEIDAMQLRTYDPFNSIAINPIVNMNPWGMRIWGNRTCLPNTNISDETGVSTTSDQLVASSFANVRILICDIKKALYKAARRCQFEQNSDVLWVNFTSSVNTLLEQMKQSYGIAAYRWTREETTERAKIKATLRIVPIEAVEDFDLTIELADSLEVAE